MLFEIVDVIEFFFIGYVEIDEYVMENLNYE